MLPDATTDPDGDGEGSTETTRRVYDVGVAVFVGIAGLLGIVVWQSLLAVPLLAVDPDPSATLNQGLGSVANGLGTASVALVFLYASGRGLAYLDLERPGWRDLGYVVVGVVALVAAQYAVSLFYAAFGVESASHGLADAVAENPEILAALIPASWLFVGPGEELLYRNTIQKSLYERFPTWAAIVATSAVFAVVHLPAFAGGSSLATGASLALVFFLSLVLGWVYARTGNLLVPAAVHGTFNVVQFLLLYEEVAALGPAFG